MTISQRHKWFQGQFECVSVAVFPPECARLFSETFHQIGFQMAPMGELVDVILFDTTQPGATAWLDQVFEKDTFEGDGLAPDEQLSGIHGRPPVLALVSSVDEAEMWLDMGVSDFFLKGQTPSELCLRLASLLHWKRRQLALEEKLLETRRQNMIMELAGATAHQLNQPLTCVIGYSDLLLKKMAPEDDKRFFVDRIRQEGERMARLVKKIGKISVYATKEYVGDSRIIDLSRASAEMSGEFDKVDDDSNIK